MFLTILGFSVLAYLLGSIPTAVWYGKTFNNIDIRQHGSGNAGATNTFRVLGKRAGSVVMAVDVLKGFTAASLPNLLKTIPLMDKNIILSQIILGLIAVIGHVFPIFAGFKGGKGVASLLGMTLAIHFLGAISCLGIFLVILAVSHYVSLGSMLAALSFPILMWLPAYQNDFKITLSIYGGSVFVLLVSTHLKNVKRLLNGTENKIYIFNKPQNKAQ